MSLPRRLLRVLPVTAAACVALWVVSQNNDDYCGTVGECLGTALDDMIVLVIVALLGPALLWTCRLPHVLAHTAALLLVGGSLWFAAGALTTALAGARPLDDTPLPLPVALAVGALTALAASYAAGPGGRRPGRVLVPVAAIGLAVVAHLSADRALEQERAAELATAPVTLYSPRIAGDAPQRARAVDDEVHLSWSLAVGERTAFVDVELVPAPLDEELLEDQVAVVRGDTVLIAAFDPALLDRDEVMQALRDAPVESAAELAGR